MDNSRKNMMKIKINQIKLFGYHGVYEIEKKDGQHFIINIVVESDCLDKYNDSIHSTIDYIEIAKQAKEIFNKNRYNLIESLAIEISDAIMMNKAVDSTTVSVKKVSPPIELDLKSVEVEYRQQR